MTEVWDEPGVKSRCVPEIALCKNRRMRRCNSPSTEQIPASCVRQAMKCRRLPIRRHVRVTHRRQNSQRLLAAWLCLFAALCLYAPLTLSAWPASQSCCAGGLCAMPEHHQRGAAPNSESSAQCDHHSTGMPDCNMSCCEQKERASVAPVAYLLPDPLSLAAPVVTARSLQVATPNSFFVSLDPLSPPPRA